MPLYAFIYILLYFSFILKISYMHSLIILLLVLYYILLIYLLQKVSYICFTYRVRARGLGRFGRFSEIVGAFWGLYPLFGRFVDSWRALGAFCVRVRACCSVRAGVRACGRAGVCPHHFLRAPNPDGFTLS